VVDGAIEIFGDMAATVTEALRDLVNGVDTAGYLAVMAYLDRLADADTAQVRGLLARAGQERPVTFGWGPRFLHSTGQYHKGGPQVGSFLQITGAVSEDLPVPGQDYTFGKLQAAQAAGDRKALADRGRPVLHLHLVDRAAGIAQLLAAAKDLR
jgi:glucose-6-phosphate isomerase